MTAGIAFLLLAVAIFRLRSSHRNHPVLIAMAVASSLYGIAQLHYFSLEIARYFAGRTFLYDGYLGITDMFLQMAVGLGMVGALLEDERLNIEEKSAALQ